MINRLFLALSLCLCITGFSQAQTRTPRPFGPVPDANQMRWQEMERYAFIHYSINTYTDQEWGDGADSASLFNPDKLDCRQWARVCKQAGMKGIILTAKHHSGFCLWPSRYTEYSVKNAPWKNGKGDIVREMADACKEYGLKLGIYLSPWDRNYAGYGRPEYITYFRNQLKELLTNYGDVFEIWFDGANGGSGYYGGAKETRKIDRTTYYDWKNTYKLIRELQPNIVIWNDGGDRGDLRWVGTEAGYVGETNWSLLNATGDVPEDMLRHGLENGDSWVPGEVNTSIRPGWFYHDYENGQVKTASRLLDTYYNSVGRNGTLLLNFPIDRHGLIHEIDEKESAAFAKAVDERFAVNLAEKKKAAASSVYGNKPQYGADKAMDGNNETYWTTTDGTTTGTLTIDLGKPTPFNNLLVQEYIKLGQRVKAFMVEALVDGNWQELTKQTTIGYKRLLRFPTVTARQVRLVITDAKSNPLISNVALYNVPQSLVSPVILRNKSGDVTINPVDKESIVYYTVDGSTPTATSTRYNGAIKTDGRVEVKAIAYDGASGKSSPVGEETFYLSRKDWKILGTDAKNVNEALDGNPGTAWFQGRDAKMPIDLVIDLGKTEHLTGFKYLPSQGWVHGIITSYQFFVSPDNQQWKLVDEGEFVNIKNNPVWQTRKFTPTDAHYIKLRALKNTEGIDAAGYAEVDVLTN